MPRGAVEAHAVDLTGRILQHDGVGQQLAAGGGVEHEAEVVVPGHNELVPVRERGEPGADRGQLVELAVQRQVAGVDQDVAGRDSDVAVLAVSVAEGNDAHGGCSSALVPPAELERLRETWVRRACSVHVHRPDQRSRNRSALPGADNGERSLQRDGARTLPTIGVLWRSRRDSNPQHPVPKTGALSIELLDRAARSVAQPPRLGNGHPRSGRGAPAPTRECRNLHRVSAMSHRGALRCML